MTSQRVSLCMAGGDVTPPSIRRPAKNDSIGWHSTRPAGASAIIPQPEGRLRATAALQHPSRRWLRAVSDLGSSQPRRNQPRVLHGVWVSLSAGSSVSGEPRAKVGGNAALEQLSLPAVPGGCTERCPQLSPPPAMANPYGLIATCLILRL